MRPTASELRQLQADTAQVGPDALLQLGVSHLDHALAGGLPLGALHEVAPGAPLQGGAATGFALALAARAGGDVLFVQTDFARMEHGAPYGPGLDLFGLPLNRLLMLAVPRAIDVLWAMEEALRSRAVAAVIGEVPDERLIDETPVTRRLSLAARDGGGLGLMLRPHASPEANAAATRWQVAAAPGLGDGLGGLGRTTFALSLTKNRRGPCGRWLVTWNHHDRIFLPALSIGVDAAARDRQDRAPFVRAG